LDSNYPKGKARYIKFCRIIIKVMKETKKQHHNTLTAKSNNEIKTTRSIVKKETESTFSGTGSYLTCR
jgi:hypothetical protein